MWSFFKKSWKYLTGSREDFSMENRAFNAVGIITFLTLLPLAIVNFLLGYFILGIWACIMSLILVYLFYLSRFRKKFEIATLVYIILSYIMLGINYFLNSGIQGPTVYGFFLTFLLIIIITPRRWHILLIFLHILMVATLFLLEYRYPYLVISEYPSLDTQITDLLATYITSIIFIYVTATYLYNSYIHEKQQTEKTALELSESNNTITEQNKKLQELNLEKDRLFSIIAHDLRNPLASIQGYLESINSFDIDPDERVFLETELLNLTRSTSNMLNNLLYWSSSQMKGYAIDFQDIDICAVIRETVLLLKPAADLKNIAIQADIGMNFTARVDRDMFELVVRNLISNAIKFTPREGKIEIACRTKNDEIEILISDTGIGIPFEKQSDIFTSKAKSTAGTKNETGIGLGLVLCYDFMKRMKGAISFQSEAGKGTTFILSLKRI